MMPTSLALERFDEETADPPDPPPGATAAALDAPPVNPPQAAPVSPAAQAAYDEATAAAAEMQRMSEAMRAMISTLGTERAQLRSQLARSFAEAFRDVVAKTLPVLTAKAGVAELAMAATEMIESAKVSNAELRVAPVDNDMVVEALATLAPSEKVSVISDAALTAGQAKLSWPDGGATFDTATLQQRSLDLLEDHIQVIFQRTACDE